LQTLKKSKPGVKDGRVNKKWHMPVDGFYDASNLPIKKALIDFAITNKVLQEQN
jgi:hypothetical protein